MYLLVVFLPLVGFIIAGAFGRFIGKQGAVIVTITLMFLTASLSFLIFYETLLCHSITTIKLFP